MEIATACCTIFSQCAALEVVCHRPVHSWPLRSVSDDVNCCSPLVVTIGKLVHRLEPLRRLCDPALCAGNLWISIRVLCPDLTRSVEPQTKELPKLMRAREIDFPNL